jgi:hypothetical protein
MIPAVRPADGERPSECRGGNVRTAGNGKDLASCLGSYGTDR